MNQMILALLLLGPLLAGCLSESPDSRALPSLEAFTATYQVSWPDGGTTLRLSTEGVREVLGADGTERPARVLRLTDTKGEDVILWEAFFDDTQRVVRVDWPCGRMHFQQVSEACMAGWSWWLPAGQPLPFGLGWSEEARNGSLDFIWRGLSTHIPVERTESSSGLRLDVPKHERLDGDFAQSGTYWYNQTSWLPSTRHFQGPGAVAKFELQELKTHGEGPSVGAWPIRSHTLSNHERSFEMYPDESEPFRGAEITARQVLDQLIEADEQAERRLQDGCVSIMNINLNASHTDRVPVLVGATQSHATVRILSSEGLMEWDIAHEHSSLGERWHVGPGQDVESRGDRSCERDLHPTPSPLQPMSELWPIIENAGFPADDMEGFTYAVAPWDEGGAVGRQVYNFVFPLPCDEDFCIGMPPQVSVSATTGELTKAFYAPREAAP